AEHGAVVIDHRHLAEGIQFEELDLLVRAFGEVDEHQFGRQLKQREQQLHTVGVTGKWVAVKFDRVLRHVGNSVSRGWGLPQQAGRWRYGMLRPDAAKQNRHDRQSMISVSATTTAGATWR